MSHLSDDLYQASSFFFFLLLLKTEESSRRCLLGTCRGPAPILEAAVAQRCPGTRAWGCADGV